LVYFFQNTIHAFDIKGECEAAPEDKAFVTVWARTDTANPYAGPKIFYRALKASGIKKEASLHSWTLGRKAHLL